MQDLTVVGTVTNATLNATAQLDLGTVVGFSQGKDGVAFVAVKPILKTVPCVIFISETDEARDIFLVVIGYCAASIHACVLNSRIIRQCPSENQ